MVFPVEKAFQVFLSIPVAELKAHKGDLVLIDPRAEQSYVFGRSLTEVGERAHTAFGSAVDALLLHVGKFEIDTASRLVAYA